jgi:hypothetical protein
MAFQPQNKMQDVMHRIATGQDTGGLTGGAWGRTKEWFNKKNAPQIGQSPYLGGYDRLISQLQHQASGRGPSLAGNAYRQAHGQGMNDVMAMSRGGSAGAARAGMRQMGAMNQGLAAGYSNARLQEQLAARQQLQGALGGASNAWFQPQQANLQATMGTQSNGQQLMGMLSQLTGSIASLIPGKQNA